MLAHPPLGLPWLALDDTALREMILPRDRARLRTICGLCQLHQLELLAVPRDELERRLAYLCGTDRPEAWCAHIRASAPPSEMWGVVVCALLSFRRAHLCATLGQSQGADRFAVVRERPHPAIVKAASAVQVELLQLAL